MNLLAALRGEWREMIEGHLVWLLVLGRFPTALFRPSGQVSPPWTILKTVVATQWGVTLLRFFCDLWMTFVNTSVPEPYLDEVFHVPQALKYCEGRYYEWDDKITTPPGLYGLSVLYHTLWGDLCTAPNLRRINRYGVLLLSHFASLCRQSLEAKGAGARFSPRAPSFYAEHVATNIALFPALFFFSALYYTDVLSAVVVLASYQNHLKRVSREGGVGVINGIWTILLGAFALFMRQTNVFWVVVYMGGLEAVHAVRSLKPASVETPEFTTLAGLVRFYWGRYSIGDVHDPPLNLARPIDWVFCVLSTAIAAVCNPAKMLEQIWPHIATMGLFAGFVVWNGGVVLGDKSNHIATLHLAQMLYIWPLFAFFSVPLLVPTAISQITKLLQTVLPGQKDSGSTSELAAKVVEKDTKKAKPTASAQEKSASHVQKSFALNTTEFLFQNALSPALIVGGVVFSLVIVKFNTIIHPFTLADNRHYMFYVFRHTILRSTTVRFSLIGAYVVSAWLVWNRLSGCSPSPSSKANPDCPANRTIPVPFISTPFPSAAMLTALRRDKDDRKTTAAKIPIPPYTGLPVTLADPKSTSITPPPTSTALLWLLTTALSLITAPLVEPRYFILPWIFWRLLVPAWPAHDCQHQGSIGAQLSRVPGMGWVYRYGRKFDLTAGLETVWFVLINLATMYMFLVKPFMWRNSDGEVLDEGRMQRFMW